MRLRPLTLRKLLGLAMLPCGFICLAVAVTPANWVGGGLSQMILFLASASMVTAGLVSSIVFRGPNLTIEDSGIEVEQSDAHNVSMRWEDIDYVVPGSTGVIVSSWSETVTIPCKRRLTDDLLRRAKQRGIPDTFDAIVPAEGLRNLDTFVAERLDNRSVRDRKGSAEGGAISSALTGSQIAEAGIDPRVARAVASDRVIGALVATNSRLVSNFFVRQVLLPKRAVQSEIAGIAWVVAGFLLPTFGYWAWGSLSESGFRGDWNSTIGALCAVAFVTGRTNYRVGSRKTTYPKISTSVAGITVTYSPLKLVTAAWSSIKLFYLSYRRIMIVYNDRILVIPRSAPEASKVVDSLKQHAIEDLLSPRFLSEGIERAEAFMENDDFEGAGQVIAGVTGISNFVATRLATLGTSDMRREAVEAKLGA